MIHEHARARATQARKGDETNRPNPEWLTHSLARSKRRDKIDIAVDVLRVSKDGAKKTQIINKVNLNFFQSNRYIDLLVGKGLLRLGNPERLYKTTDKGLKLVEEYQHIQSLMT